jgi:hypothetical protein
VGERKVIGSGLLPINWEEEAGRRWTASGATGCAGGLHWPDRGFGERSGEEPDTATVTQGIAAIKGILLRRTRQNRQKQHNLIKL